MTLDHIAIYQWLSGSQYLIRRLLPAVRIIDAAVDQPAEETLALLTDEVKIFFFHLNCTVTSRFPRERDLLIEELQDRDVTLINHRVTDVSKKEIQRHLRALGLGVTLADREGPPDERLMVKSNLNFAGASERYLSDADRDFLGVGTGSGLIWNPYHYLVRRREEVKDSWWHDENLAIERFVDNSKGLWYRAYLMWNRVVLCLMSNEYEVKKVGESRLEKMWQIDLSSASQSYVAGESAAVIDDVVTFRDALCLDYGSIDIVIDEEHRPFIIDVNPTPAYNHPVDGLVDHLSGAFM